MATLSHEFSSRNFLQKMSWESLGRCGCPASPPTHFTEQAKLLGMHPLRKGSSVSVFPMPLRVILSASVGPEADPAGMGSEHLPAQQ